MENTPQIPVRTHIDRWLYLPSFVVILITFVITPIARSLAGNARLVATERWVIFGIEGCLILVLLYSLFRQYRYLKPRHPRIFLMELALFFGICVIPVLAAALGDAKGASVYHTSTSISLPGMFTIFLFSLVNAVGLLSLGNSLLILFRENSVIKVIGAVLYGLLWIVLSVVFYVAYAISYSVHNPSNE